MKAEDQIIHYRPELAEDLHTAMDYALKLYNGNMEKVYYTLLSAVVPDINEETSKFLLDAANCFDGTFSGYERFQRDFKNDLRQKHHVPLFNYYAVGAFIFPMYQSILDDIKVLCIREDFTKQERFNVESFFNKLTAPLRNPNVYIQEGSTKCFYDENTDPTFSFEKDMKSSIEYIKENCPWIIELFTTQETLDEEEKESSIMQR